MDKSFEIQAIEKIVKLPIRIVTFADKPFNSVFVKTPMGEKEVSFKEKHYPFLFGSTTETEKSLHTILEELKKLEEESRDYLLEAWIGREKYREKYFEEKKSVI